MVWMAAFEPVTACSERQPEPWNWTGQKKISFQENFLWVAKNFSVQVDAFAPPELFHPLCLLFHTRASHSLSLTHPHAHPLSLVQAHTHTFTHFDDVMVTHSLNEIMTKRKTWRQRRQGGVPKTKHNHRGTGSAVIDSCTVYCSTALPVLMTFAKPLQTMALLFSFSRRHVFS